MLANATTNQRQTKYCKAIKQYLLDTGHATNSQILSELKGIYPEVSATTVHRATARLASRGELVIAPHDIDGSIRYDSNLSPHDHFMCTNCGILRDSYIRDLVVPIIESTLEDCRISGRLTIGGLCKNCEEQ